ncbi:MAG: hypothetical protein U1C58_13895 [Flavobacteriaceae bacterium]|nr:hypothetical protein [Flavobacteriaceae bacterium]
MKKDALDNLFENLQGQFDTDQAAEGHFERFAEKLSQNPRKKTGSLRFIRPFLVAASLALLFVLSFLSRTPESADLASVSPEMQNTQVFFTNMIQTELDKLKAKNKDETTQKMVTDALGQLALLEKDYESLKKDLVKSGYNQQVIYAMISNFQSRINLLKTVLEKIEKTQELKITQKNEII